MKNSLILIFTLALSSVAMAQEKVAVEAKKEITKEVKVIEENGVKTLTIITAENGVTSEEIFTGEAADKKMAELKKEEAKDVKGRTIVKNQEMERKEKMAKESGTKNL